MTRAKAPTSHVAPSRQAHVPALDGIRGLAIAGVLLFHTGHLAGGFLGVDLFFVLSGFLITGLLLRDLSEGRRLSLSRFWARRIRRLFPALAVLLAGVALVVWCLQRFGAEAVDAGLVRTTFEDGLWVQLHLVNWHLLAQDASYWESFGQSRLFAHLWSISVEEQFYVVWPLLLVLLTAGVARVLGPRRRTPMTLGWAVLLLCAVLASVSQVLMILLLDPADPTRVYTGTDTRAFSLLLGAAAATEPARLLFSTLIRLLGRAAPTAMLLLAGGLLTMWLVSTGTDAPGLFTGGLLLHVVLSVMLIGLCVEQHRQHGPRGVLLGVLELPALRWLGEISYSLYLWHWPVIVVLEPIVPEHFGEWARALLAITVSVLLAAVSKHLIEDPVRFRAGWARGGRGAAVFAVVSLALLALWCLLPMPGGQQIDIGLL